MKKILLSFLLPACIIGANAQDKLAVNPRAITPAEYDKAKTFTIKDLDKDTYAKFDNKYILDRYEMRKPYFITGDDGLKKRIDLYKLIAKDSMQELGTLIFYTNEKGKLYTALQPNFTADGKIWERYFEDIHGIDKEEKNFVLKLSYVLSKEMSFQLYKALNNGKNLKESGTYGTDICFPGEMLVSMHDGSTKALSEIKPGDVIITVDPATNNATPLPVSKLVQHEKNNYAITKLLMLSAAENPDAYGIYVKLSTRVLEATPNHPMTVSGSKKKAGDVALGDEIICLNERTNTYHTYKVFNKTEVAAGLQKVYNMEVSGGATFIMNGVMVLQK